MTRQSIADQTRALEAGLVSREDIERRPAGSPERLLLEYWSAVQFGDLPQALLAFDPLLVRTVGIANMTAALRNARPLYRSAAPSIDRTSRTGATAVIRYFAPTQPAGGKADALAMTFERLDGRWRIVYSSALDHELRIAAQDEAQAAVKPGAEEVSSKAAVAGNRAAALQSAYLDRRGRPLPGAPRPRPSRPRR